MASTNFELGDWVGLSNSNFDGCLKGTDEIGMVTQCEFDDLEVVAERDGSRCRYVCLLLPQNATFQFVIGKHIFLLGTVGFHIYMCFERLFVL